MSIHAHLVDRNQFPIATIDGVDSAIARVGVVVYEGLYYVFMRMEVQHDNQHLFFGLTDAMVIK